jgi:hypothetical protein
MGGKTEREIKQKANKLLKRGIFIKLISIGLGFGTKVIIIK